jgi:two-component system, cell cycle response regulator
MRENDVPQVLIVDNDPGMLKTASAVLKREGYKVTAVSGGEEALSLFNTKPFEIIVIEVSLPGINGLDVIRAVKRQCSETQVIVTTGDASLETVISAIRAGAYDYLAKPLNHLNDISGVVGRAADKIRLTMENTRLINDLKKATDEVEEANRRLQELAIRDGLTGLYNHRYLQESLSREVKRARRDSHIFSVIFIDVDHFKQFNDTHGHPQGDTLLREIANIFRAFFRKSDIVTRYGGEEFVILLPETPKREAFHLAEEVRRRVETTNFMVREKLPSGKVTVSLGVASFPEDGSNPAILTMKADKVLYMAKQLGRNRACVV